MMGPMRSPLLFASAFVLCACGSSPPPAPSSPTDDAALSAATPAPSAAGAAADDPGPHFRPIDLTSACPHDVHLYFGDQPGDGKGHAVVAATGTPIPVPRGADGTMVVWVVDDKGFGLASVHVTKAMRHVRIDAACAKIDADSTR
jgi:hypothetical protein